MDDLSGVSCLCIDELVSFSLQSRKSGGRCGTVNGNQLLVRALWNHMIRIHDLISAQHHLQKQLLPHHAALFDLSHSQPGCSSSSRNLRLSREMLLNTVVIEIIMTHTIETTLGDFSTMEKAASRRASRGWTAGFPSLCAERETHYASPPFPL